MNPKLSPLKLLDFAIINCNFKFIAPKDKTDIRNLVESYIIDIDFAIISESNGNRVFIKASINQIENTLPGYSIFAEGVAVFDITKTDSLSTEDKKSLLQFSSVSIALNSLRGFITSLTANAPFGKYTLPSIDVNDLFNQKSKTRLKQTPKNKQVINKD